MAVQFDKLGPNSIIYFQISPINIDKYIILSDAKKLEAELTMLQSEVDRMRNLTWRMFDEYLDLDLLDEQARDILGQIRSDEVIIQ